MSLVSFAIQSPPLYSISVTGRRLHGSPRRRCLEEAGTDEGREARSQFHDGHAADEKGMPRFHFSTRLFFIPKGVHVRKREKKRKDGKLN